LEIAQTVKHGSVWGDRKAGYTNVLPRTLRPSVRHTPAQCQNGYSSVGQSFDS